MPLARTGWASMTQLATSISWRGLLDEVIAAEPAEDAPVADLIFHFAHPGRLGLAAAAAGGMLK